MRITWSVSFLLCTNIIGSTVLRCLVNSVSFIRLLGVSLVVIEWQTFSSSRHLTKYCACISSECSLTFGISASTCRCSTLDILWQPVAILRTSFYENWMFLYFVSPRFVLKCSIVDDRSPNSLVSHQWCILLLSPGLLKPVPISLISCGKTEVVECPGRKPR